MHRSGTVTILGAGACADAGYPLASDLLEPFLKTVKAKSQMEIEIQKGILEQIRQHGSPEPKLKSVPTHFEWFQIMWKKFEEVAKKIRPLGIPKPRSKGRPHMSSQVIRNTPIGFPTFTPYSAYVEDEPHPPDWVPYLETFFAFYDDYMRPSIFAMENDPRELREVQWRFRELRNLAIETVYRELSAYGRTLANYLTPLFVLRGPEKYGCAIVTLNHDVALEQIASTSNIVLYDGFKSKPDDAGPFPPEWKEQGLENLRKLWEVTAKNCHDFKGFKNAPIDANLLLKLHGSLGWYVLEEGSGDIGYRDELRHNTTYRYFRIPHELLWLPEKQGMIKQIAIGGQNDPVTNTETRFVSRKAGAVWIQPYLIFARALKSHPDRLYIELMTTLTRLLDNARRILVIGYSWGDPHVNDLILDAVAQGASLINVSKSALQKAALALWIHRFPTTFQFIKKRLFMFGGGAKRVLEEGIVELPSGESKDFDFIESVENGLPIGLSLDRTLSL